MYKRQCNDYADAAVRLEDSGGTDTVTFTPTNVNVQLSLGTTAWQAATAFVDVQLASPTAFENLTGGSSFDFLSGNGLDNQLVGGGDADTFFIGHALGGGGFAMFGNDAVTDFGTGADAVDLATGLSVRSGLGTATVVIWDGANDYGTLTASNGRPWVPGDFT